MLLLHARAHAYELSAYLLSASCVCAYAAFYAPLVSRVYGTRVYET